MINASSLLADQVTTLAMDRIPRMPKGGTEKMVRDAAVEFEAVFAAQMLEPMFAEISTDGLFGGGHAEGIYKSLMIQEFGKLIARQGGFGLADTVANELLKIQEVSVTSSSENQEPSA